MTFRMANIKDANRLDELLTKLIEDERTNYDSSLEPMVVEDFYKNALAQDYNVIYICEEDGIIVGYIYLILKENDGAKIDALFVEEEYRRRGIASKLLDMAIDKMREEKVKHTEISVLSENVEAKKLYQKKGFIVFKEILKKEI